MNFTPAMPSYGPFHLTFAMSVQVIVYVLVSFLILCVTCLYAGSRNTNWDSFCAIVGGEVAMFCVMMYALRNVNR